MEELEQANSAVEIAMKKVGPATGLASDVTMLLELLKPHMNSLSMNAADIIARIEGDVKSCADARDEIQGMREWRNASGNPTDAVGYAGDGSSRDGHTDASYGGNEASGRGRGKPY